MKAFVWSCVCLLAGLWACNSSGDGDKDCDRRTDAGARVCCGREQEAPGITCVDLSADGGEFGIYGRCIGAGEMYEGKIVGARCCDGLVRGPAYKKTDHWNPATGLPEGCAAAGPPSILLCLPCGDGECDSSLEDHCNCNADCPIE